MKSDAHGAVVAHLRTRAAVRVADDPVETFSAIAAVAGGRARSGVMRAVLAVTLACGLAVSLSSCIGVMAAGGAVGAFAAVDRRSLGAQTEDQAIELKAQSRLSSVVPDGSTVSVTSYNRKVLLTGFVKDDKIKADAEKAVAGVQNIRSLHNEIQIGFKPSLSGSASDAAITARVRGALLEAKDLQSNAFKVVTEGGNVYLMGLVTQREGDRGAQVASTVPGVQRVVTLFEYLSEDELANLRTASSPDRAPVAK